MKIPLPKNGRKYIGQKMNERHIKPNTRSVQLLGKIVRHNALISVVTVIPLNPRHGVIITVLTSIKV